MTTQRTQPSTDDPNAAAPDKAGLDVGVKVCPESLGLVLLSCGMVGTFGALGALHWAAGLSAFCITLCVSGMFIRRHSKPRWQQDAGAVAAFAGYAGQTTVALYLLQPLGWLAISALAVVVGLWMSSTEGA
ncbi:hypothetical protein [Streptomyces flaveolus]|uniref:hypothetical protein n=1 Tax=Streptomyces flaveolus TaxID=67297 RepID=UPI0037030077